MMCRKQRVIEQNGKKYIEGRDFFGDHDVYLIQKFGYENLNFNPSTPPKYR